jgi:hypothetical protein
MCIASAWACCKRRTRWCADDRAALGPIDEGADASLAERLQADAIPARLDRIFCLQWRLRGGTRLAH